MTEDERVEAAVKERIKKVADHLRAFAAALERGSDDPKIDIIDRMIASAYRTAAAALDEL